MHLLMLFASVLSKYMADNITIEQVQGQEVKQLVVPLGTTIGDVLGDVEPAAVGIFGKLRSLEHVLQAGDRIEVYQPLYMDPKEARRVRAKQFKK